MDGSHWRWKRRACALVAYPCAARAYCKKRGTNFYPWRAGCNAKLPQESVSRIRATGALRVLRARSSTGLPTVRISDGAGCYTSLAVEAAMTQMNCNHAAGMFVKSFRQGLILPYRHTLAQLTLCGNVSRSMCRLPWALVCRKPERTLFRGNKRDNGIAIS